MAIKKVSEYDRIIDALNEIDEQVDHGSQTYEEQVRRSRCYDIVAEFIDHNAKH